MLIGGLQRISLIDYPDHLAAVIFTIGCNWRCPFCHNPELVNQKITSLIEQEIFGFLASRQGKLDGVVITGGEPTIQKDLPDFIKKITKIGYLVKLDTNGSQPAMLEKIFSQQLVNYVAMDVKTRLNNQAYQRATGTQQNWLPAIKKSIELIKNSQINYEFRTTLVPGLVTPSDLLALAQELAGARRFVIQQFIGQNKTLDKEYQAVKSYLPSELRQMKEVVQEYFGEVEIRGT